MKVPCLPIQDAARCSAIAGNAMHFSCILVAELLALVCFSPSKPWIWRERKNEDSQREFGSKEKYKNNALFTPFTPTFGCISLIFFSGKCWIQSQLRHFWFLDVECVTVTFTFCRFRFSVSFPYFCTAIQLFFTFVGSLKSIKKVSCILWLHVLGKRLRQNAGFWLLVWEGWCHWWLPDAVSRFCHVNKWISNLGLIMISCRGKHIVGEPLPWSLSVYVDPRWPGGAPTHPRGKARPKAEAATATKARPHHTAPRTSNVDNYRHQFKLEDFVDHSLVANYMPSTWLITNLTCQTQKIAEQPRIAT